MLERRALGACLRGNPAEMMIAPLTPAAAHSAIRPGTDGGGVTITARSIRPGISRSVGIGAHAKDVVALGVDGQTVPPNGLLIRFHSTVRPTLPSFSVAPMTATERGRKIASSGLLVARRTSDALSGGPESVGMWVIVVMSRSVPSARRGGHVP